jgi:hypothetical protein
MCTHQCACARVTSTCVFCVVANLLVRVLASGVTWTSRTSNAPWAGRSGHSSVIDAAGAIYVIGGYGYAKGSSYSPGNYIVYYKDVYVSTDGGADRTRRWNDSTWVLR